MLYAELTQLIDIIRIELPLPLATRSKDVRDQPSISPRDVLWCTYWYR